jgi:hypothetical protein
LPPERSIGTCPRAINVIFLINPLTPGEVKYSLFAKNVTFLETTRGINIESLKERWFEAIITGPVLGTCLSPVTFGLKINIKSGIKNDFNILYGMALI